MLTDILLALEEFHTVSSIQSHPEANGPVSWCLWSKSLYLASIQPRTVPSEREHLPRTATVHSEDTHLLFVTLVEMVTAVQE